MPSVTTVVSKRSCTLRLLSRQRAEIAANSVGEMNAVTRLMSCVNQTEFGR